MEHNYTHLRGKYAIQQRWMRFCLSILDAILKVCSFRFPRRKKTKINRILLISRGHLGDAVLLTALFRPLKQKFSKVFIGVVAGSWTQVVLANHPDISYFHIYDYWRHNRSQVSLFKKIWIQITTGLKALREIRRSQYELVIVLSPFFGSGVFFSFLTGITHRIGYESGGFGPLLTQSFPGPRKIKHITDYHMSLLSLGCGIDATRILRTDLPLKKEKLPVELPKNFILINVGAGAAFKKWPLESWVKLLALLQKDGHTILAVGAGENDEQDINFILRRLPSIGNIIDLSGQLSWDQFVFVVSQATLVISHDSISAHVASSFEIPTIVIFSGVRASQHCFYPLNSQAVCLSKTLPCNPCFMVRQGCDSMACIKELAAHRVYQTAGELLNRRDALDSVGV